MPLPALGAAMLAGSLLFGLGGLVIRTLVGLGIGYVVYQGADTLVGSVLSYFSGGISAAGSQVPGLLQTLQIGPAINVIFSAYIARISLLASRKLSILPIGGP